MRPRKTNIGSVSHGTMRNEDLIPDFIWELRHQSPCKRAHLKLCREIEMRITADSQACENAVESGDSYEPYFESEESSEDLQDLFDALEAYAPPYFYFGAHIGDGSDYGFWLSDSFMEDFDGLRVSDLSEVPRAFSGEVATCNDHGNISLYRYSRGRARNIWSIV